MKKLGFIVFLLFVSSLQLFALELKGTRWGPEPGGEGSYLTFLTERNFEYGYAGSIGGPRVIGTYIQNGNSIVLSVITISDSGGIPDYFSDRRINCTIVEISDRLSNYKIIGRHGMEFWSIDYLPTTGEIRVFQGQTIQVYRAKGRITENARLRMGPGTSFEIIDVWLISTQRSIQSIPKDTACTILGYSRNRTTIDGVEAPWYYVKLFENMRETYFGWVWGGLIEIIE